MGNIVKLVFQAVGTGSGLSKMYGEVKGLAAAMPGLTKATMILGGALGSVGASVGRMATMLLQGGIWGAAAEGARLLIEKFGLFKDRTEETKEKLDKLAESTRKFYETINENSQKSIEKIDKETKRRNEQLDITNRMIKAELQLQKARAIASGDTQGVERIDRQMTEQDQKTAMQKAQGDVDAAARSRDVQESKMAKAIQEARTAEQELKKADAALAAKSKPILIEPKVAGPGVMPMTVNQDTTNEQAAVKAAQDRLVKARELVASAKEAYAEEVRKYNLSKDVVKVLEAEQKAAEAAKQAAEAEDRRNRAAQVKKDLTAHATKSINAGSDADWNERYNKASDEQKIAMLKEIEAHEKAVMEAAEKDLETVTKPVSVPVEQPKPVSVPVEQPKPVSVTANGPKPEEVKDIIARSDAARERMLSARQKRQELEQKKQDDDEKNAKKKAVDELRKKADATREQIQREREAHAEVLKRLAEARAAVPATIDVLGNAGKMDQAGDIRADRQKDITDERFNDRFTKLLTSGKIKKDANGNWKMDGRASNLDKAVLDRLNAQEKVKRAEAEAAKERKRLENMEGYLKTISDRIKDATEI